MNHKIKTTSIAITLLIIAACNATKKNTTSTTTPAPASSNNTTMPATNYVIAKSASGFYEPGNEELTAIQLKYHDVTLDKLKEGYTIYAKGACINCHGAMSIYNWGEEQWKVIIDDMSLRANISDTEKDAVYKYVLAIKATEVK